MKKLMILGVIALAGCGKSGDALTPLDAAARQTCMNTIESRATNAKSVSYINKDPAITKDPQGQLQVSIDFSAKNEIGMASRMVAKCVVSADGKTLVDIAVRENR
ncbi:hypothetical protein [Massilia soli]|uniref:Lipoprotein n=1 Tax=Massilia soli TaxID=2792854 RepID=A0ABS7SLD6_9BURK|nr:hypothetical protein [Massilia soli]MBZ2206994.1 hypothetical protein [Massilia soli]